MERACIEVRGTLTPANIRALYVVARRARTLLPGKEIVLDLSMARAAMETITALHDPAQLTQLSGEGTSEKPCRLSILDPRPGIHAHPSLTHGRGDHKHPDGKHSDNSQRTAGRSTIRRVSPRQGTGMKPGRMVMLVLGTLAALLGLGLLAGAAGVGWLNFQQRDEGYFTTQSHRFDAASSAITRPGWTSWSAAGCRTSFHRKRPAASCSADRQPARARRSSSGSHRSRMRRRYLEGVKRSEIRELNLRPFRVDYTEVPGHQDAAPPRSPGFLGRIRRRHRHAGTQMEHPVPAAGRWWS